MIKAQAAPRVGSDEHQEATIAAQVQKEAAGPVVANVAMAA